MVAPLAIAGLAALGGIQGGLGASSANAAAFKARQTQRDLLYRGLEQLNPANIAGGFQQLQGLASPFLNQMLAGQALAGQGTATALQAGLGRAGLGSTGLGAALGAGALQGAAFQGNTLRSRMLLDLLRESIGLQQARANPFFAAMGSVPGGGGQSVLGGAGAGAAGVLGLFGLGQTAAPAMPTGMSPGWIGPYTGGR